jgi:hypothetical protein
MTELQTYELQLEEAIRDRDRAQEDARDAKFRLDRETKRIRALSQVVKGLRALADGSADAPQADRLPDVVVEIEPAEDGDAPRGQEAVRRLMRESGRAWRPAELIAEIQRRHWIEPTAKTPGAAVRVALKRLVDAGEVVKVEQGVYRYQDSGVTTLEEAVPEARGLEAVDAEGA